jgi:hypothetical protein
VRTNLVQIDLVEHRQKAHHADRIAFPGRVELLFFLEERRQLFAHEEHAVLRFLRPDDDVGRNRQVEELVRPHPSRRAPTGLHFVEHQRDVVDAREQPQALHESRARRAHTALSPEWARRAPQPPVCCA